jgi:hypothetical protein
LEKETKFKDEEGSVINFHGRYIYATLCYYILAMEVTRTKTTVRKYVDNAANGLALQIEMKVFLLEKAENEGTS